MAEDRHRQHYGYMETRYKHYDIDPINNDVSSFEMHYLPRYDVELIPQACSALRNEWLLYVYLQHNRHGVDSCCSWIALFASN